MVENDLKTLFITKKWSHHTHSGGYHQLCNYSSGEFVNVEENDRIPFKRIRNKIRRKLIPSSFYTNMYGMKDMIAEWKVFRRSRETNTSVVHAIYAEDQLNFLLSYRQYLKAALVGTFHLPEESVFMKRVVAAGYSEKYKNLDAAVVVSKSMMRFYRDTLGIENLFYIPHGIDTDTFSPNEDRVQKKAKKPLRVLTVGSHGRDWKSFKVVSERTLRDSPGIEFHVVGPKNVLTDLKNRKGYHLYSGIPEEQLIKLYRTTDLLFIPLHFATANNTLLEALACGTPVISTNIGGIPDYLDESCGWLLPVGDVRSAVELLKQLSQNPQKLIDKKNEARRKALQFDWREVASEFKKVYQFAYDRWLFSQSR